MRGGHKNSSIVEQHIQPTGFARLKSVKRGASTAARVRHIRRQASTAFACPSATMSSNAARATRQKPDTVQPSSKNILAVALPIPELAPVIRMLGGWRHSVLGPPIVKRRHRLAAQSHQRCLKPVSRLRQRGFACNPNAAASLRSRDRHIGQALPQRLPRLRTAPYARGGIRYQVRREHLYRRPTATLAPCGSSPPPHAGTSPPCARQTG